MLSSVKRAVFVCLGMALAGPALADAVFDNIFVFGDSLSDIGNVSLATGGADPASPPYAPGRYSNGALWVEHIAGVYGLSLTPSLTPGGGNDYAYAGAETTADVTLQGQTVPSLVTQTKQYLAAVKGKADPKALYVVWGGSNDVLGASIDTLATLPIQYANKTKRIITLLKAAGAKSFLVPQLPDIGLTPSAIAAGSTVAETATGLAKAMNAALTAALADPALLSAHIYRMHNFRFQDEVIVNDSSTHLGFTNVTTPCLTGNTPCADPDHSFFWDDVHPTAFVHALLAAEALAVLPAAH